MKNSLSSTSKMLAGDFLLAFDVILWLMKSPLQLTFSQTAACSLHLIACARKSGIKRTQVLQEKISEKGGTG